MKIQGGEKRARRLPFVYQREEHKRMYWAKASRKSSCSAKQLARYGQAGAQRSSMLKVTSLMFRILPNRTLALHLQTFLLCVFCVRKGKTILTLIVRKFTEIRFQCCICMAFVLVSSRNLNRRFSFMFLIF